MRELLVIGIGAGDPDQVTVQAIKAMNRADTFFIIGKGDEKQALVDLRTGILDEHVHLDYKVVEITDPPRGPNPDRLRGRRRGLARASGREIRSGIRGPNLASARFSSGVTLPSTTALCGIVERVLARGRVSFDYSVIPGITSVQSLAAQHRIVLNRIGEPIHITTGRKLAEGLPDGVDNAVVMLDAHCTFTQVSENDAEIWWGAYLGTPDEELISGKLRDVEDQIVARRAELREKHGWIMDTYLVRR